MQVAVFKAAGAPAPDTTAPAVSVTAPAPNATVSGTVTLSANASDNVGVARVEFLVDGGVLAADPSSPYSVSWNTPAVSNGTHTVAARAFDAANNFTTTSTVTVTVANNSAPVPIGPPTVISTDPATGAVTGLINVTDPDGDALNYTITRAPTTGAVTVNAAAGTYTYTPTQAWRDIAAQTTGPDYDNFQVTASDGQGIYNRVIEVEISPTPPPRYRHHRRHRRQRRASPR